MRSRALLANVGLLAKMAEEPAAPVFRHVLAQAVVATARYLRLLGFTRRDVRRLGSAGRVGGRIDAR